MTRTAALLCGAILASLGWTTFSWATPARTGLTGDPEGDGTSVLIGDERGYVWIDPSTAFVSIHSASTPDPLRPIRYARQHGIPATGSASVYVLAIDFPDLPGEGTVVDLATAMDQEVGAYFDEVSRNQLDLRFIPLSETWIRMENNQDYYGSDGTGVDDANQPIFELAREALIRADGQVDFAELDENENGRLDAGELHLMIIHSGTDQAETGRSTDIWSHRWWIYGPVHGFAETIVDGVLVSEPNISGDEISPGYVMVSGSDALGVVAHELLHSFGAPDLYSLVSAGHYPVGPWSLMDVGLWLGAPSGSSPCRPGGYLEWDVDADPDNGISGWVTPEVFYDGEHVIGTLGSATETEVGLVHTPVDGEFFLLENRQQGGIDAQLYESGVLIYHVDSSEPVNNIESTPPFRVWLEDPGSRTGKKGAAYSEDDGPAQAAFTPGTDPSTDTNDGQASGITITAIGPEEEVMSLLLQGAGEATGPASFLVGPNPSPAGYVTAYLPEQGGANAVLELYDMAGRRVTKRDLPPGARQYSLALPTHLAPGTFILTYRSPAAQYRLPLIYLRTDPSGR